MKALHLHFVEILCYLKTNLLLDSAIFDWVCVCQDAGIETTSAPVWRVSLLLLLFSLEQLESMSAALVLTLRSL